MFLACGARDPGFDSRYDVRNWSSPADVLSKRRKSSKTTNQPNPTGYLLNILKTTYNALLGPSCPVIHAIAAPKKGTPKVQTKSRQSLVPKSIWRRKYINMKALIAMNVNHQVLCRDESSQGEAVIFTELTGIHVVLGDDDVQMIGKMRNVITAVTNSEVNHKTLALIPREKSATRSVSGKKNQNGHHGNKAEDNAHDCRNVNGVKLTIVQPVQRKVVAILWIRCHVTIIRF